MKKLSLSIMFILAAYCVNAQITTTNWLFQFDEFENTYGKKEGQRRNTTIKMLNTAYVEDTKNLFGAHLFNQIKNNNITAYKDVACTQPYQTEQDLKDFYKQLRKVTIDTVIVFDPKTLEEEEKIVRWETVKFPSKEIGYRVRQDWDFDQNTQKLNSTIKSLTVTDIEEADRKEYFSVKVKDGNQPVTAADFKNDDFILVQRISYTGNFAGKEMEKYLMTDEHFTKNKVWFIDGELSVDEIHRSFEGSTDTIITFDPETFAEEIEIVKNAPIVKSEIVQYRIIQDFYLDPLNMVIKNKIIAIAPLRKAQGKQSEYLSVVPIFWIVYDEAFFKRGN